MATTALIVEILVVGALAVTWMAAAIVVFFAPEPFPGVASLGSAASGVTPLLLLPFLALIYSVGWIVNFVSQQVLRPFVPVLSGGSAVNEVNSNQYHVWILQHCSESLIADLAVDRTVIRLARGGIVNFLCFAVVAAAATARGWIPGWSLAGLSLLLAGLSFAQWHTRHKSHRRRVGLIVDDLTRRGVVTPRSADGGRDLTGVGASASRA